MLVSAYSFVIEFNKTLYAKLLNAPIGSIIKKPGFLWNFGEVKKIIVPK